jgi:hypothetical protein
MVFVSTEGMVEKHLSFLVLYGQYQWWDREVCCSDHGGGQMGCVSLNDIPHPSESQYDEILEQE